MAQFIWHQYSLQRVFCTRQTTAHCRGLAICRYCARSTCRYPGTKNLKDKLGKVINGTYCGHPNRNSGHTYPKQCSFIGVNAPASKGYMPPIATVESSTNGVLEYTANNFGGQLKGNLILSKYTTDQSPGKVFRVKRNAEGNVDAYRETLVEASGLSIEMSPYGDVLMPRVYKKQILVLRPLSGMNKKQTVRSVMPPRGSFNGGNCRPCHRVQHRTESC